MTKTAHLHEAFHNGIRSEGHKCSTHNSFPYHLGYRKALHTVQSPFHSTEEFLYENGKHPDRADRLQEYNSISSQLLCFALMSNTQAEKAQLRKSYACPPDAYS